MSGEQVYLVLVTAPRRESARIARVLVERRLAACVNVVGPIRSTYWWEGKVEEAEEDLLLIKTTGAALDRLLETVKEIHPYEVPEAIALPVAAGLEAYLDWVRAEVRSDGGGGGPEASGGAR